MLSIRSSLKFLPALLNLGVGVSEVAGRAAAILQVSSDKSSKLHCFKKSHCGVLIVAEIEINS